MNVLALDSATEILSVALNCEGKSYYIEMDAGLHHSERFIDSIEILLKNAAITSNDLDLLACMQGPGSFTGLRIGYSALKGMAFALNIPYISIPSLDCMAYPYIHWPGIVLPLIDAKKKSFFGALYRGGKRISGFFDYDYEKIMAILPQEDAILVTGPDAALAMDRLGKQDNSLNMQLDPMYRTGKARELLSIARETFAKTGKGDAHNSGPLYIRKSDAELARDAAAVLEGVQYESD